MTRRLLYLVIGGEINDAEGIEFVDPDKIDFVGAYTDHAGAYAAWREAAQRTVDRANVRYFLLPAHKLPELR